MRKLAEYRPPKLEEMDPLVVKDLPRDLYFELLMDYIQRNAQTWQTCPAA